MTAPCTSFDLMTVPDTARAAYRAFLDTCREGPASFCLTPRAEATPYALCFGIFGLHLLQDKSTLTAERDACVTALVDNMRRARAAGEDVPRDKQYRQLLAFTLSALAVLDALDNEILTDLVVEQLPAEMEQALHAVSALDGKAQSGNQAMFLAIFLCHARDRLGRDVEHLLKRWVDLHLRSMNRWGFWGPDAGPTHLHFQNGYHQYEMLEYLAVENPCEKRAVEAVKTLADPQGHFAPYPGGGGCYDYDAVFVLTPNGSVPNAETASLLQQTAATLLAEQRPDGGFCESYYVRPRSPANLLRFAGQIRRAFGNATLLKERTRYALALQRPAHDRIHTHWSRYQRRWAESDLWDSWFRMLTLARIETAFDPAAAERWGFINYPGIGWHPALRSKKASYGAAPELKAGDS